MNYGEHFPILEYYKRFVIPINRERYYVKADKIMVCPLHNDHDPSMGLVQSKGEELFHCFGCNQWGNIVELHIRVCKRHLKKYLSEEESLRDLCRIFNIAYDKLPKPETSKELDKGIRQELELAKSIEKFDISDFKSMLLEGKRSKKGIAYFNTVLMVMLNEVKERED